MSSTKTGFGIRGRRAVGGRSSSRLVRDEALPSCLRRSEKEDSAEEEEDEYDASDGVYRRTAGFAGKGTGCTGVRWLRRAEIVFGAGTSRDCVGRPRGPDGNPPLGRDDG
jgi:hypothetical protein